MTMPATASSTKSPPLRGELLPGELLDDLPLDHRLGRRCPEYPGGGAASE
jgi:hypothetical protein